MVKLGLIGVGYLGSRHLKHLASLDGVALSSAWDVSSEALSAAQTEYGVTPALGLDDLISKSDGVVVVSPTTTHFDIGMKVIEAGKPLFIEKPICATLSEGRDLVAEAERRGIPVQVGHIERFNRAFRALKSIGIKPRFVEAHRLALWNPRGGDVAVIHDLMIHDLDLIIHLAGSKPSHIHANGVGVITPSIDIANARLEFPTGLVANITASRISLKRMRKLRLFGEREYIALDLGKGTCEYVGADGGAGSLPVESEILSEIELGPRKLRLYRQFLEAPEDDAMRLELTAFRDIVARGALPPVSGRDGLMALEAAEEITKIIKETNTK
jgi:predicted dehydrogenase